MKLASAIAVCYFINFGTTINYLFSNSLSIIINMLLIILKYSKTGVLIALFSIKSFQKYNNNKSKLRKRKHVKIPSTWQKVCEANGSGK